ncbi:type II toxin-antitoxin system RelE/ParE family toxin [Salinisphaera sp. SWV1]|uniref:type II toxin-antitoxin system RelE/ParE family toxin n=1 Tax=Salinisphaera sp. SWV1 TaxID=3454139 RepID=UPI003F854B44
MESLLSVFIVFVSGIGLGFRTAVQVILPASARRCVQSVGRRDEHGKPAAGHRLEMLRGDYRAFHSMRINGQWRIVFRWQSADAHDVAIVDYHA